MSRNWNCPICQTLLGIRKGDEMEIRYKTVKYVVKAADSIEATCRKCGREVKSP